jgi:hypothetical protein
MIQPNGTDAKDIALHFIKLTDGRATPDIIKKTIIQAKSLLSCGYTKQEIMDTIDFLIDVKKKQLYSLGYVNSCINNVLREIKSIESKEKTKQIKTTIDSEREEIKVDEQSKQRNRDKLSRFGVQPRFGEKFDFDLFKEPGQND